MSGGPREPRHQCPTCTESGNNLIFDNKRGVSKIIVAGMASRIFQLGTTATRCVCCKFVFDICFTLFDK